MLITARKSWLKYTLLAGVSFITFALLFTLYRDSSGARVTLDRLKNKWSPSSLSSSELHDDDAPLTTPVLPPSRRRANATLVMLVRNSEIESAVYSIRQVEDRFNKKFGYPWVFLNDEPFTEEFKYRTSIVINSNVSYGLVPREHWVQPQWIDEVRATAGRQQLEAEGVLYGGSLSYRNMCRFNSGYFYRHELLQDFRYYWRVEPNIQYYCDIDYDPFLFMEDQKKVYGFTIALYETVRTVPTLWSTIKEFTQQNPQYIHPNNALKFLSDDGGDSYNWCHFWSNFEIADMDFWRDEAYSKYFDHLDRAGGFYYERWGDAPVHSIAAALFLPKDKLHFFSDIGYKHSVYGRCPQGALHRQGKCSCNPRQNFDYDGYSCLPRFQGLFYN